MEREDNFRLKRFKELKTRKAGGKILCALCKTELEQIEICEFCQSCQEPRKKKILVCPLCEKHAEDEELDKEICRKNVCKKVASKVSSSLSKGDKIKFDDVCSCSDAVGDVLKLLCPNCQTQADKQKKPPEQCSCEKIENVTSVNKSDSQTSICSCKKGKDEPKEMNMDDLCKIIGQQKIKKLKEIYLQKQQSEDEILSKLKEVFDNDSCSCGNKDKINQKGNNSKPFSSTNQNNSDLCPICAKDLTKNAPEQECPCAESFVCEPKENSRETLCSKCKKDKTDSKRTSVSDPGLGAGKKHTCNLCQTEDMKYSNRLNSKSETLCSKCKNEKGNPKNMTIQFTMSCLSKGNAFNSTPKENTQKKDDLLKVCSHIDEIINLTSQYKTSNSVEEFIEACKDAKCKINKTPDNKEKLEEITPPPPPAAKKCVCKSSLSKQEEETIKPSEDENQELGVFVTKFQEVVTVKRYQNSDGTIRETRQVITIRTETKNPSNTALSETQKSNKQSCLSSPGTSVKQINSTCSSQSGKQLKITIPNENVRERSSQTSSLSKDVSINSYTSCTISSDGEESRISIEQIDNCSAGAQTDDRDDICDKCKRMAEMKRKPPERSFSDSDTQDRSANESCAQRKSGVSKSCCAIKVVPKAHDNLNNNKEKANNCLELLKKILLEADQSTASGLTKQTDDMSYDSKFSNNTLGSKKKCNCKPEPSNTSSHISCASCPSLSGGSQQKCCHTRKSPNQINFCKRESTPECPECSKKEEENQSGPKCICKSSEDTNKSAMKNGCSCISQKNSKAKTSTCPSCASKSGPKNAKSASSCASAKSTCSCMQDKEDNKTCCMKSKQKCCPKEDVPSCPACGPKQKPPEPPCPCSKKDKPIPKQSCTSCSSKATQSSKQCRCSEDSKEDDNDTCCASNDKKSDQCNKPSNCSVCDYKPPRKSSGCCGPKSKGNTIVYMSCFMPDSMPTRQPNRKCTTSCGTQTNNKYMEKKTSPSVASCNHSQRKDTPCSQCKQQNDASKTSCPVCKQLEVINTPCPICKQKEMNKKNAKKCSICGTPMDAETSTCNCTNKANKCSMNPGDTTEDCCSSSLTPKSCCEKARVECPNKDIVSCPGCVTLQSQKPPCTCESRKISIEHKSCLSCGSLISTKSESCICTDDQKSILNHDKKVDDTICESENDSSKENSSTCSICSKLQPELTPLSLKANGTTNEGKSKSCVMCGAPMIPESSCGCASKPSQPIGTSQKQGDAKATESQKNLKDDKIDIVECECYPPKKKVSPKSSKDIEYVYTPIIPCHYDEKKISQDTPSRCPLCNSTLQPEETFVKTSSKNKGNPKTDISPERQPSPTSQLGTSEFKCCSKKKTPTCPSCGTGLQHKESPCSCNSPSKSTPTKILSSNSLTSPTSSTCSCKEMAQQTRKSCYEIDANDQLCFAAPAASTSYYKNPTNQCCSRETSSSCLQSSSNAQDDKSCPCKSKKPEPSKSKPCASCGNPITPKQSKKCCDESNEQQSQCCEKPKSKCCSKDPPKEEAPTCTCKAQAEKPKPAKTCASCGEVIKPKPHKCGDDVKTPAKASSLNRPPSRTSNKSTQSSQSCPVCTPPKATQKCDCKKEKKAEEKKCTCKKEPAAEEKKCTCKKEPKPEPKCTCKKEPEVKESKCSCKKEPEPAKDQCNCKKGASQSSTPARSVSLNMTPQKASSNTSKATQKSCPACSTDKKPAKKPENKCSCKKEPPAPEKKCTCKKEPKPAEKKCTCKKEPEPPAKKCSCKKEPEPPAKKCTCKKEPEPPAKKCTCKKEPEPPAKKCTCKKEPEPPAKKCTCKKEAAPPPKKCNCKKEPEPPKDECSCQKDDQKPSKYTWVTKSTSVTVKPSSNTSLKKSLMKGIRDEKSDASVKKSESMGAEKSSCSCASVKDLKKVSDKKSSSIRIQVSESSCPSCGPKCKDAATSTRRTERYDVRNLEMMKASEPPKKKACTCFSESYVGVDNWGNTPARANSYHGRCYH